MACVMPMLVNKGSTSTIEERKTMVDTFLCGASRIARPITINRVTIRKSTIQTESHIISNFMIAYRGNYDNEGNYMVIIVLNLY